MKWKYPQIGIRIFETENIVTTSITNEQMANQDVNSTSNVTRVRYDALNEILQFVESE